MNQAVFFTFIQISCWLSTCTNTFWMQFKNTWHLFITFYQRHLKIYNYSFLLTSTVACIYENLSNQTAVCLHSHIEWKKSFLSRNNREKDVCLDSMIDVIKKVQAFVEIRGMMAQWQCKRLRAFSPDMEWWSSGQLLAMALRDKGW